MSISIRLIAFGAVLAAISAWPEKACAVLLCPTCTVDPIQLDVGDTGTLLVNESQSPGGVPVPISVTPATFPMGLLSGVAVSVSDTRIIITSQVIDSHFVFRVLSVPVAPTGLWALTSCSQERPYPP